MITFPVGLLATKSGASPSTPPSYEDSGTIVYAAGSTTLNVPYMATVNNNDIIIMQIMGWGTNAVYTPPSGWTELSSVGGSADSPATFWYRADGTETGNETMTSDISQNVVGVMNRFSGCRTTGNPYEALTDTALNNSASFDIPSITTLGDNRLAVSIFERYTIKTLGTPTDYTIDYNNSAAPASSQFVGATQIINSAGIVAADSFTANSASNWHGTTFALIPS